MYMLHKSVILIPLQGNFSLQQRPLQKTTTNQNIELRIPVLLDPSTSFKPKAQGSLWKDQVLEDQEGSC